MTEESIRSKVSELIQTECLHSEKMPTGNLAENLDSVQRLTLVVAIEDHFEICFEPEDEEQVETLNDVVRLIQGKLASQ